MGVLSAWVKSRLEAMFLCLGSPPLSAARGSLANVEVRASSSLQSLSLCSLHAAMRGGFGVAQCPRLAAPEYTVMCEDLGEGIGADGCAGD